MKKVAELRSFAFNPSTILAQIKVLPRIAWYGFGFLLCIVIMATPLARLGNAPLISKLPTTRFLLFPGKWLPLNFGFNAPVPKAEMATHILIFIFFLACAFVVYLLAAPIVYRSTTWHSLTSVLRWILLITLIGGLLFLITPSMISHDVFVYSGYGRVLIAHRSNPYFIPLAAFPHDPFISIDDWKDAPSAYGPVWLGICGLVSLVGGEHPLAYVLIYRLLALTMHLLNVYLIISILRTQGHSARIVALGALLYAWNPLALLESSFSGHNDVFMVSLLLLGFLFCVRAEQQKEPFPLIHLRTYLLPLLAFTLATLVKFTALPVLVLFLVFLTRQALLQTALLPNSSRWQRWRRALLTLGTASVCSGAVIVLLYGPYWLGSGLKEIIYSFTSPPSANESYGSALRALWTHSKLYGIPTAEPAHTLFMIFLKHSTWSLMNALTVGGVLLASVIWVWRNPTTRTVILGSLATLGMLLLATPWFFPWYVTWLVGLLAIAIPPMQQRLSRALIGAALTFSASALCIYIFFREQPPLSLWVDFICLTTIAPPIIMFVLLLLLPIPLETRKITADS